MRMFPNPENSQKLIDSTFTKICEFTSGKGLSPENRICHMDQAIRLLRLLRHFDNEKTQSGLKNLQMNMFDEGRKNKNSQMIGMSIAIKEIMKNLEKGKADPDAQAFYHRIDETILLLDNSRKELTTAVKGAENKENAVAVKTFLM